MVNIDLEIPKKEDFYEDGIIVVHEETWEEGGNAYIEFFKSHKDAVKRVEELLEDKICEKYQIAVILGQLVEWEAEYETVKRVTIDEYRGERNLK